MLIDTHVHSKPHSSCSWLYAKDIPMLFKNSGFSGFMLTNHFFEYHLNNLGSTYSEQIDSYIDAYNVAYKAGKEIGIQVFFGAEVRVTDQKLDQNNEPKPFRPEFLLVGITPNKLKKVPILYKLNQKELFEYANANDILIYQAHPYRTAQGYTPANLKYTHGIEVFNGHPHFLDETFSALKLAKENKLLMLAGSDMHIERQAGTAGIDIPEGIKDSQELYSFLKQNKPKNLNKEKLIVEF